MTDLEYLWNLLSLSSVHVSLGDWSHVKQFTTQERTKMPITNQAHSSNVLDERNRHLLDIQYHRGVGLFLILLIVVEQNLLTAYDHILQIFSKDNERKTDTALKGWTALSNNPRNSNNAATWRRRPINVSYLLLPSVSLDITTIRNGQPTLQPGF